MVLSGKPCARRAQRELFGFLRLIGLDLEKVAFFGIALPQYFHDLSVFRKRAPGQKIRLRPILHEAKEPGGVFEGHYFWQDLLVAKRIFETNPRTHVDVGSRIDGFVAHLLAFREVTIVDIREIDAQIQGLSVVLDDCMSMSRFADASVESLSSLHAVEHFGLGRYGDPIHVDGHIEGMKSLQRVLAPDGRLWLSVPLGNDVVEFNAQRLISPATVVKTLNELELISLIVIPSKGCPKEIRDKNFSSDAAQGSAGLFEFIRKVEDVGEPE